VKCEEWEIEKGEGKKRRGERERNSFVKMHKIVLIRITNTI
jgi:hypothetical protein